MTTRARSMSLWRSVVLVGLLSIVQLQSGHAAVNILWRYTVLSWDNPASQLEDQLASETALYADLVADARERVQATRERAAGLAPNPDDGRRSTPALSSGITRSPPAA